MANQNNRRIAYRAGGITKTYVDRGRGGKAFLGKIIGAAANVWGGFKTAKIQQEAADKKFNMIQSEKNELAQRRQDLLENGLPDIPGLKPDVSPTLDAETAAIPGRFKPVEDVSTEALDKQRELQAQKMSEAVKSVTKSAGTKGALGLGNLLRAGREGDVAIMKDQMGADERTRQLEKNQESTIASMQHSTQMSKAGQEFQANQVVSQATLAELSAQGAKEDALLSAEFANVGEQAQAEAGKIGAVTNAISAVSSILPFKEGGKVKKKTKKYGVGGEMTKGGGDTLNQHGLMEGDLGLKKDAPLSVRLAAIGGYNKEGGVVGRYEQGGYSDTSIKPSQMKDMRQVHLDSYYGAKKNQKFAKTGAVFNISMGQNRLPANQPDVTPGEFSHGTNPIDIVQDGEKIGEMTGGEVIMPNKNVNQFKDMLAAGNKEGVSKLMGRLLTKWETEAAQDSDKSLNNEGAPKKAFLGKLVKKVGSGMKKFAGTKVGGFLGKVAGASPVGMLAKKIAGGDESPEEAMEAAAIDPSAEGMEGGVMNKAQMAAMEAAKAAGAPGGADSAGGGWASQMQGMMGEDAFNKMGMSDGHMKYMEKRFAKDPMMQARMAQMGEKYGSGEGQKMMNPAMGRMMTSPMGGLGIGGGGFLGGLGGGGFGGAVGSMMGHMPFKEGGRLYKDGGGVDKVKDKVSKVKDKVTDKTSNVKDKVTDKTSNIKDKLGKPKMNINNIKDSIDKQGPKFTNLADKKTQKTLLKPPPKVQKDSIWDRKDLNTPQDLLKFGTSTAIKKGVVQPAMVAGLGTMGGTIGAAGAAAIPAIGYGMFAKEALPRMLDQYAKGHKKAFGPALDELQQKHGKGYRDRVEATTHAYGMPNTYNRKW